MFTVAKANIPTNVPKLIALILQENRVTIDDGVPKLPPFAQTIGLGNNLSPLLFCILQWGGLRKSVEIIFYGDDLMIYESKRFQAPTRFHSAVTDIGVSVNLTEAKLRRRDRTTTIDTLNLARLPFAYENLFLCLELRTLLKHIEICSTPVT